RTAAALRTGRAALQLFGMCLLQLLGFRHLGLLLLVAGQSGETAVEPFAAAGQGFGVLLQALARLAQLLQMDDALLAEARQRLQQNAEALTRCRERLDGCLARPASHPQ
ncbi:hypothetical protein, partial [Stutzerimonas stutzeri]|uniref:hypothetical protein n=1 Tax=Stutzerimonas stutzeri TaxID=316 RepID=UPI0024B700F9